MTSGNRAVSAPGRGSGAWGEKPLSRGPPMVPEELPLFFPPGGSAGGARALPCEGSSGALPGPALPADKMAAPMELSCWGGDWGLPSLHPESLTVMVTAGAATRPERRAAGRDARCRGLPRARRLCRAAPAGKAAPPPRGALKPGAACTGRGARRRLAGPWGTARGAAGAGMRWGRAGPGRARGEPPGRGQRCAATGGGVRRRYRAARDIEISFGLIGYCTSLQWALTRTLKNRSLLLV